MDGNQFDRLTREMAATSRRDVLKRGFGANVGGAVAVFGVNIAGAVSKRGRGVSATHRAARLHRRELWTVHRELPRWQFTIYRSVQGWITGLHLQLRLILDVLFLGLRLPEHGALLHYVNDALWVQSLLNDLFGRFQQRNVRRALQRLPGVIASEPGGWR